MTNTQELPYGEWPSPLTVERLATDSSVGFGQLRSQNDRLFWIERRASDNGRSVIVGYKDGDMVDVTPAEYSVGSTVHEYGGNAYCLGSDELYFVNIKDQNLYKQSLLDPDSVHAITKSDINERFADPVFDEQRGRLICVRERHTSGEEAVNDLVAIALSDGTIKVLHQGHDFYSNARISPNGKRIAFLAWDHPNMPWNGTQLYVAELAAQINSASIIAGGKEESVFGPQWLNDKLLVFSSDRSGFYDLYAFGEEGTYVIAADEREYGSALWQVGSDRFQPVGDNIVVAVPDHTELVLVDAFNCMQTPLESDASSYHDVIKHGDGLAYIESHEDAPSAICVRPTFTESAQQIKTSGNLPLPQDCISKPQLIEYAGSQGEAVFAYFYAPHNEGYAASENERPPLLVQAHGGPTGSASSGLSASIQFYTSRGWSVLDVNYSGSTGYGRSYRDRLLGEWGNRDVEDIVAGVRHLIAQDLIDAQRVAIAGGSAGGYTVLRGLTTSNVFKAGASRYGIGDLRALANDTHKFESRYIDQLVPEEEIDSRSPINQIEKLSCPVIFTQGLDDQVVPPNQAQMMFEALKEKGIPTVMFLFEGERHGFRKLETVIKAMKANYYFFSLVFGFTPDGIDQTSLDGAEVANLNAL